MVVAAATVMAAISPKREAFAAVPVCGQRAQDGQPLPVPAGHTADGALSPRGAGVGWRHGRVHAGFVQKHKPGRVHARAQLGTPGSPGRGHVSPVLLARVQGLFCASAPGGPGRGTPQQRSGVPISSVPPNGAHTRAGTSRPARPPAPPARAGRPRPAQACHPRAGAGRPSLRTAATAANAKRFGEPAANRAHADAKAPGQHALTALAHLVCPQHPLAQVNRIRPRHASPPPR